jgi:hypothetical protein
MNAMTQIHADDRAQVSPIERAHRRTLTELHPGIDDLEMAARVGLVMIRDQASFGWSRACPEAAEILRIVDQQAGEAVHAPFPTSRLLRIRWSLELTMMAARAVERAQRDG